ncbi:MAG: hypothetical protein LBH04_09900 [Tannerellaceae bacterium]|nr:hypothetical protein [Tannerellaceae bacterium]
MSLILGVSRLILGESTVILGVSRLMFGRSCEILRGARLGGGTFRLKPGDFLEYNM